MPKKKIEPKKRRASERSALLGALKRDVADLMKHDLVDELDEVLTNTGFLSNMHSHRSKDIGPAILALAPLLDADQLAGTVHTAAFHRAYGSKVLYLNDGERTAHHEFAEHAAGETLKQAGGAVFKRFLARLYVDRATFAAQVN